MKNIFLLEYWKGYFMFAYKGKNKWDVYKVKHNKKESFFLETIIAKKNCKPNELYKIYDKDFKKI